MSARSQRLVSLNVEWAKHPSNQGQETWSLWPTMHGNKVAAVSQQYAGDELWWYEAIVFSIGANRITRGISIEDQRRADNSISRSCRSQQEAMEWCEEEYEMRLAEALLLRTA